jgi:hypothetical protein
MGKYKFYMQGCDKYGNVLGEDTRRNLEEDFEGMRYSKAEGLDKVGKPKNVYTESYSDSDRLRTYVPDELVNEATTVTFTFYFIGDDRRSVYDSFIGYVRNGYHVYVDDARKKYLYFMVNSAMDVAEEKWYGGNPYLKLDLTVQNIFGRTFDVPKDGKHII